MREYVEIFFTSPKIKCVKLLPHLKLYNEEEKNEYQKKRTRSSRRRKFKQESNMYILQEHKDGTKEMKPIRYRRGLDHDEIQLCIDDLLDVLPSMIPVGKNTFFELMICTKRCILFNGYCNARFI